MYVNVKDFGAVGNGIVDDTAAIQAALTYAGNLYGGDITGVAGYVGWFTTEVIFPRGTYLCGKVIIPRRIKLKGCGQSVIKSLTGTSTVPAGFFVDNPIYTLYAKRLTFLYYDTCFRIPTNNSDMAFITFSECSVAKTNLFVDTVSYAASRSTTFRMERCHVSYGVKTLAKIYTDKSSFVGNWFLHSNDSIFMYLDSFAAFRDNMWIPVNAGPNKAYIEFNASDLVRSLSFSSERFGGENGSCPIVIVRNVNAGGSNEAYRQQGVSFADCFISSNSVYNPDGLESGVRACVVLRPSVSPLKSINYVDFKNCSLAPDLVGGVVQTYNVTDISSLLPNCFTVNFDYISGVAANKGINCPAGDDLTAYVRIPA